MTTGARLVRVRAGRNKHGATGPGATRESAVRNPHVYNYEAMKKAGSVKRGKPRMLHRTDCPHQAADGSTIFRPATRTERATLPECADCARKEARS
jgi:hypothetical protein